MTNNTANEDSSIDLGLCLRLEKGGTKRHKKVVHDNIKHISGLIDSYEKSRGDLKVLS